MLGTKDFAVCVVLILILGASPVCFAGGIFGGGGGFVGNLVQAATGGVVNLNPGGAVLNTPKITVGGPGGPTLDKVPGLVGDFGARMLDGGANVITFGKVGRDRDRQRAEDAETLANAQLTGAENTKSATKNGLEGQLSYVNQSIAHWTGVTSKIDSIADYQNQLVVFSQKVLTKSINREAALKSMGVGLQDARFGLHIMVENLSKSPQVQNPLGGAEVWDTAIAQVSAEVENSHEEVQRYLNSAILSADDQTLTDFIAVVSQSRNNLIVLKSFVKASLDSDLDNKKNIEAQLAALK